MEMRKITLFGELIKNEDGEEVLEPNEPLKPFPSGMKDKHHKIMLIMYQLVMAAYNQKRKLPITYQEWKKITGIPKKDLKELEGFGYIKAKDSVLYNQGTGQNHGVRKFIYWTPQGRSYIQEYIKHEQPGTNNSGVAGDCSGVQPQVQGVVAENGVCGELSVELQSNGSEGNGDTNN